MSFPVDLAQPPFVFYVACITFLTLSLFLSSLKIKEEHIHILTGSERVRLTVYAACNSVRGILLGRLLSDSPPLCGLATRIC